MKDEKLQAARQALLRAVGESSSAGACWGIGSFAIPRMGRAAAPLSKQRPIWSVIPPATAHPGRQRGTGSCLAKEMNEATYIVSWKPISKSERADLANDDYETLVVEAEGILSQPLRHDWE